MGVNVREGYMRLYNGCTENWNITVQNLVIIFLWGVSLSVPSINWNLKCLKSEKTSWICWKYCMFFVPFFLFSLIFYGHIILRSYSFFHTSIRILIDSSSGWNISNPCGLWDLTKVTKQRQSFHHVLQTLTTFWKQTTSTIPIWYKYALSVLSLANSSIILKISSSNSIHILYMYIYNHSYQKVG